MKQAMGKLAAAALSGALVLSGIGGASPGLAGTGGGIASAADDYIFYDTFESGAGEWSGRSATVAVSTTAAYQGSGSLAVTGRSENWNGAIRKLDSAAFKAGTAYSFSVCVMFDSGSSSTKFHLTMEYSGGGNGKTYNKIASETTSKGDWVQLANPSFTIPANATDVSIYVETDTGSGSFYIDEAIAAPDGTVIAGPKPPQYAIGDVNGDGGITAVDLTLAKRGAAAGTMDAGPKKGADVNQDKTVDITDLTWFSEFLTGSVSEFPEPVAPPPGQMRTISEYTPAAQEILVEREANGSTSRQQGVTYPEIVKKQYFSKKANKQKNVNVMLPANYDPSKQYPVLYILHGFFEDEDRMIKTGNTPPIRTPEIICNAIAAGEAVEMIVVVPFVFTHASLNNAVDFGDPASSEGYDNFVDDIVDSLMPWVEENYSVATGRENTAVTGFSMGGRESLQIGMKYPDKFGYVGAICPAPGAQGAFKWNSEEEAPSLVMVTGGTQDDVVRLDTPQGYHQNFEKNGVPHLWHVVNGGHHGDDSILAHIYNFVRMVFKA